MEKMKKMWKELSVFGIVIVVFLGLFAYRKLAFAEYSIINETKVVDKIKSKDNFVVVVGKDAEQNTLSYKVIMQEFIDKNRDADLYYVDLTSSKNAAEFIKTNFSSDEATFPQTFVIKDGKVTSKQIGTLSYYRLNELFK